MLRTNLRRPQIVAFFKKLPRAEIIMEACGSSHHWAEVSKVPPAQQVE